MDESVSSAGSAVGIERTRVPASAIVFGGSGAVGSRMVRLLASRGVRDIAVADRRPPRGQHPNVRFLRVNVREPICVPGRWEVAYNFSAVRGGLGRRDEERFETNVAGAINVTNFCRERGIETIVFTSSTEVYGPNENRLAEGSPVEPTSGYGRSQLLAEHIHRTWYSDEPRRKLVVVRPSAMSERRSGFRRLRGSFHPRRLAFPRLEAGTVDGYVDELVRSIEWVRNSDDPEVTYDFAYPSPTVRHRYLVENGYPFGAAPDRIRAGGARGPRARSRRDPGDLATGSSAA